MILPNSSAWQAMLASKARRRHLNDGPGCASTICICTCGMRRSPRPANPTPMSFLPFMAQNGRRDPFINLGPYLVP